MSERKASQGWMTRDFAVTAFRRLEARGADDKDIRFTFTISSAEPVTIWRGMKEILGHEEGEVDMDFIGSGRAPFLWMHDPERYLGVIESARNTGKNVEVTVRMADHEEARAKAADMERGMLSNISVGYRVHKDELVERDGDNSTWKVTRWEPKEASLVTIPADASVGLGRADDPAQNPVLSRRQQTITTMETAVPETIEATPPRVEVTTDHDAQRKAHDAATQRFTAVRKADNRIRDVASRWGLEEKDTKPFTDQLDDWRNDPAKVLADFQAFALERAEKRAPGVSSAEIGFSKKEAGRYSLARALDYLAGEVGEDQAGLEIEASEAIRQIHPGRHERGLSIPSDMLMRGYAPGADRQRNLISVGLTGGGQTDTAKNLVETELRDELFLEALRENSVVLGLGPKILGGLKGKLDIPSELINTTVAWVAEDTEPAESNYGTGKISLDYKTLAGRIPITHRAMLQTIPGIEGLIAANIRRSLALGFETAIIKGNGSTEPEGILNASGIGSVSLATFNFANFCKFLLALSNANVDTSNCAGITNSTGRYRLITTQDTPAGTNYIGKPSRDNRGATLTALGPIYDTNLVPGNLGGGSNASALIYGDWSQVFVGYWGAVEFVRDTSTKIATRGVTIRIFLDAITKLLRTSAFAAAVDIAAVS